MTKINEDAGVAGIPGELLKYGGSVVMNIKLYVLYVILFGNSISYRCLEKGRNSTNV